MNTYIINLNDTIAMSDSLSVELVKDVNTCQPCFQEAETNLQDVWIAGFICATMVLVVGLVVWVLCIWISGKNKLQMAELKQRERVSEIELKKQELEIELRKLDAEVERNQKEKGNELHRERYKQETEQAKLDAELERKIKEKEFCNEKK